MPVGNDKNAARGKKVYLSVWLDPELKELLEKHAGREDRSLSTLGARLLRWSAQWLDPAGGSQALMDWEASPGVAAEAARQVEMERRVFEKGTARKPKHGRGG
jgi:hypothetical protein